MNYDFIAEHGERAESELAALLEEKKSADSLILLIYTTKFECVKYSAIKDIEHLTELRLFDERGELKATRSRIGAPFKWRYISDEKFREKVGGDYEKLIDDEEQYLDIDATKTDGTDYVSIGGGHYTMPSAGLEKVHIRNYCFWNDEGILKLADFRIVGFVPKGA